MAQRNHWGHALTAIGLVGALAACSNSLAKTESASVTVDPSKVGIATRAQAALAANDLATALSLGEHFSVPTEVAESTDNAGATHRLGNRLLRAGVPTELLKLRAEEPTHEVSEGRTIVVAHQTLV